MEDMLVHYEYECTFHTVECLRCGEEVLHRELAMHYVAGCSAATSSARAGNTSSDSQALTLEGVTVSFENLKALLRDASHEQLLPVIQSEMNELIEQIRDQERRSEVITHAVAAPATSAAAQVAAPGVFRPRCRKELLGRIRPWKQVRHRHPGPARTGSRNVQRRNPLWPCREMFFKPCAKHPRKIILSTPLLIRFRVFNVI
ncbi:hypothetical protein MTO96_044322 [Rhipicephalus appendiculatus]